jgi:hypothetical protein
MISGRLLIEMGIACVLLGATLSAASAGGPRPYLQVSSKLTMKQIVDACGANDAAKRAETCDEVVSGIVSTIYEAAGDPENKQVPRLCLPDPHQSISAFRAEIVSWLRAHPVAQKFTVTEAIYPIAVGVYQCKSSAGPN